MGKSLVQFLFQVMKSYGLKPDLDLYNELIRKYCDKKGKYYQGLRVYDDGSRPKVGVTVYLSV